MSGRTRRPVPCRVWRGPWTSTELGLLRYHWGMPLKSLAKVVGRTPAAAAEKARQLKLGKPSQEVSVVARQIGIDREALLKLCKRHSVRVTRSVSSALRGRTSRPRRYVDPDAAVAAYESEMDTETAFAAAKRFGHDGGWVVRRLRAAGVWKAGWWVRYPTSVIDAAVASYRPSGGA